MKRHQFQVRSFVKNEHDVLNRNEPIFVQIGTSDPQDRKGMKRSTLEITRSKVKVKVTRGRS